MAFALIPLLSVYNISKIYSLPINASRQSDFFIKNIIPYDADKVTNLIKTFNAEPKNIVNRGTFKPMNGVMMRGFSENVQPFIGELIKETIS